MLRPNEVHQSQYRVYVEDTDLMGIIYHGKYLYFFERARTDMLRANGISLTMLATYDTYFAIRDIHIRYHLSGRLDDMLTIQTHIELIKGCSLSLKQMMYNQANQLLSEATVQVVTVDGRMRPKRLSEELKNG